MPKSKSKSASFVADPEQESLRLINILAELCQCDPAGIEWDGSGSVDTVSFQADGCRYMLKLAKESVQGKSVNTMDFRVRVITMP